MLRTFLVLLAAASWAPYAPAQPFPARAVKIVVPYPLSGPTDVRGTSRITKMYKLIAQNAPPAITDTLSRIAAEAIRGGTRHAVAIERKPGGATTRGATSVARSAPDGHTLLLASDATLLIAPRYFSGVTYDALEDFVLVAPLATMPFVLMVNATVPVDGVQRLVAWLKVRPGEINYGSSGDGSTGHLAGERFRRMAGLDTVHVSYNGGIAALNAVATHHVSYMFAALPLALPYLRNQYVRPLAVTTAQRLDAFPDVPTVAESGVPGYAIEGWYGIFAPGHTPMRAVSWLGERIAARLSQPAIAQHVRAQGLEPVLETPARFATRINSEAYNAAAFVEDLKAAPPVAQ